MAAGHLQNEDVNVFVSEPDSTVGFSKGLVLMVKGDFVGFIMFS